MRLINTDSHLLFQFKYFLKDPVKYDVKYQVTKSTCFPNF